MSGLNLLASVRPVFNAGTKTLTFTLPSSATKGRLLVLVVAYDPADGYDALDGWTVLNAYTGTAKIELLARVVEDNEPETVELDLDTAGKDWLGQLLVYEPGSSAVLLEANAGGNFAADATPPAPTVTSQQAANLDVRAWSVAGSVTLDPPAGMEAIDSYDSDLATARSFLIASAVANASGALGAKDAAAGGAATGSAVSYVFRDRPPVTPAVLYDPVPGNIGFFGQDDRPPRESGLP